MKPPTPGRVLIRYGLPLLALVLVLWSTDAAAAAGYLPMTPAARKVLGGSLSALGVAWIVWAHFRSKRDLERWRREG